jgi:predicted permease
MTGFWQDLVHGARSLRRHPVFAVAAVAVLGLTIGLNTSLFTLFSALALRAWPVKDPERVVQVSLSQMSSAEYRHLADRSTTFTGLAAFGDQGASMRNGAVFFHQHVSGNFFRVLGVDMAVGRGFRDDEDRIESPQAVAVLSYAAWQREFGGDRGIVGRELRIDKVPFTIVGVAPRSLTSAGPLRIDAWLPLASFLLTHPWDKDARDPLRRSELCCGRLAGRLAPGAARVQARTELATLSRQFRAGLGWTPLEPELTGTTLVSSVRGARVLPVLGILFLALTLVMLLACANVAHVLLARGAARKQEIAIRLSLGASRPRLVRQLLTEGLALALGAAALGLAIAFVLPGWIAQRDDKMVLQLQPDATVLAYAGAMAVLACIGFALAPALHVTRQSAADALKAKGARPTLRGALLAFQVAISIVLLSGAGLLTHAVRSAQSLEPGFAVRHISAVELTWAAGFDDRTARRAVADAFSLELATLPGAPRRGLTSVVPLDRNAAALSTSYRLPADDVRHERSALTQHISAGYFDVLRIPIVAGRSFAGADDVDTTVMVNETLARQSWPAAAAVGQLVIVGKKTRTVVGVVKDTHTRDLDEIRPLLYEPLRRGALPSVLVHDLGRSRARAIADLAKRVDPRIEARVFPLADNIDPWLTPLRRGAAIASGVGAFALMLAAIGLSGVFGYVVQQRTREIGIRITLGARASHVLRLVFASSARSLAAGTGLGLLAAMGAAQLLRSRLYGLSPLDPIAYVGALLLMMAVGLVATYVPARRALRVDPAVALRYE